MRREKRSPWFWVPTLYYAEGIPYIIVMTVSVVLYKRMGVSNTDIALYTSWLYLPWVIKPLWSPIVDIFKTKRLWIVIMQLLVGAGLGGVALTIPLPDFFKFTLAFFWLLAFSSATHDIAADGFYMLGMTEHQQAFFVGVRSTFYRFAMITGQGLLIILAGFLESTSGLDDVYLQVNSKTDKGVEQMIHPDSVEISEKAGEQRIVHLPGTLDIGTTPITKSYVDSVKQFVKQWNIDNGHAPEARKAQDEALATADDVGWWNRFVVQNLEAFIVRHFAPEVDRSETDKTGNIGLIYFHLAKKPEMNENIVVHFGRDAGDKSISLVDEAGLGGRLVFNESNWNKPGIAIIQLDYNLDHSTQAEFKASSGNIPLAWSITFFFLAVLFLVFFIYHKFILPYPAEDRPSIQDKSKSFLKEFFETFILFFKKKRIGAIVAFLLLYRLAESQIVKLAPAFLIDTQEAGGMALTTGEFGLLYGTVGLAMLTVGGILGGFVASRHGLNFWLWPMAIAMNLPNVVYIYLSYAIPDNFIIINLAIAIEQFGYGFGFTAYMLYMIFASQGEHKTAHFAITTGFMALGMMLPGMMSGWLQELIGYQHFFIWVVIATIPSFLVLFFIPLDKEFGKRKNE
ncbi:MAG: MFS transporter [Caldithrix sp.]|nr:MFS transporter [Caldithrix sp.]